MNWKLKSINEWYSNSALADAANEFGGEFGGASSGFVNAAGEFNSIVELVVLIEIKFYKVYLIH